MNNIFYSLSLLFFFNVALAQEHSFEFGKFSIAELNMKVYKPDTTANAVVLNEFGEAYISNDGQNLIFEYHVKIKILKSEGLAEADFTIPLRKHNGKIEVLTSVEASSFTMVNGSPSESKLENRSVFSENTNKYWTQKKFAVPNVRAGSVIEVQYTIQSPFFFYKFWPWNFQSELPKVQSIYWATFPGNYNYNISLRGFLPLTSNESEIIPKCFSADGGSADCVRYKFGMQNIPAFAEEEYMTAASNFLSAVNFELIEVKYFDGRIDKITKEWKDVEDELKRDERFGIQLKRGKDIVEGGVEQILAGETDPLSKAKKIFDFIKYRYEWNERYGHYSDLGIRKAFESKSGNVGDINLSLIAALKYAGLDADPMILSTRENGIAPELFPVLTDFNYVIAKLNIGDKVYLLDATDHAYPFGILPVRCLNGKGRVLATQGSYWYDIKPADKRKEFTTLNLKLDPDGFFRGTINNAYIGYKAISKRKEILTFSNHKEYITSLDNNWSRGSVKNYQLDNVDFLNKPISENLEVEIEGFDDLKASILYFNPFLLDRWEHNPFQASERLYPVDFGTPIEEIVILTLELPDGLELAELPAKVALALPNNGGRFIYEVKTDGNKIIVNHALTILKPIFSPEEYHYLKELFARVIQLQNADLVLKHKSSK